MKHFEQLWVEAEGLVVFHRSPIDEKEEIKKVIGSLLDLATDPGNGETHVGNILLSLCSITQHRNIDAYHALAKTIAVAQQTFLDHQEELKEAMS